MKKVKVLKSGVKIRGKERQEGEVVRVFDGKDLDSLFMLDAVEIIKDMESDGDVDVMPLMEKDEDDEQT